MLLLDEPSLGLAPIIVEEVLGLVRRLVDTGMTIVLVEQNVHDALEMADRGYVLDQGQVAMTGHRRRAARAQRPAAGLPRSVMSSTPPDAVTVACGAGFAGDRIEPAVDAARSGLVDTVVLECLAERTLVGGLQARRRDPAAGYDTRLRRRLTPLLPAARATGTRVVSNLGSANPAAAAEEVARLARELGLTGLRVAAVLGDDVAASTDRVSWSGEHPTDPDSWLGVHAYLGMEPIAQALAEGADVVLTGRVADSALFSAPVAARHDLDAAGIAAATTIGHLLECSGQLTGGNLADLRRPPLPAATYADLGFPLATVAADGSAEIWVSRASRPGWTRSGAPSSCSTRCTTPAPTSRPTRRSTSRGCGSRRSARTGSGSPAAVGGPRPERLKAVGFRQGREMVADMEIAYAGEGCVTRARTAAETMTLRLRSLGIEQLRADLVGVDSVLWEAAEAQASQPSPPRCGCTSPRSAPTPTSPRRWRTSSTP